MKKAALIPQSVAKGKTKEPKLQNDALKHLTIADLPTSEKQKVSTLVQTLVNLGKDHEAALAALAEEKAARTAEAERITTSMEESMAAIENKLQEKDRAIEDMDTKHALAMGLLALYQGKLKNSSEMFRYYELTDSENKIKIAQLESDIISLQSLVSTQKSTIESFQNMSVRYNDSLQKVQESHQQALSRAQDELAGAAAEARRRDKHVASLQAQIEQLRAEVSAKDSALARVQEQLRQKVYSAPVEVVAATASVSSSLRTPADHPVVSGVVTQAKSNTVAEDAVKRAGTRSMREGAVPVRESWTRTSADDSLVFGAQTNEPVTTAAATTVETSKQSSVAGSTHNKDMHAEEDADPYAVMYGSVESSFNMSHMSYVSHMSTSNTNLSFSSAYRMDDNDDSLLDATIGNNTSVDLSQEMDLMASAVPVPVAVHAIASAEPTKNVPSTQKASTPLVAITATTGSSTEDRRAAADTENKALVRADAAVVVAGGSSRRTLLDPTPMKPKQRNQQQQRQQQPGLSGALELSLNRLDPSAAEDTGDSRASRLRASASEEAVPARALPAPVVVMTLPAPKQSAAEPAAPYSRRRLPPRTSDVSALDLSLQKHSHGDHNKSGSRDLTLSADESSRGAVDRSTLSAVTATTAISAELSQLHLPTSSAKKGLTKKKLANAADKSVPVHTATGKKKKEPSLQVTKQKVKSDVGVVKDSTRPASAESSRHRTFDSPAATNTSISTATVKAKDTAGAAPGTPPPAVRYTGTSPSAAEAVLTQVHSLPQLTSPPPAYTIARPDSNRKKVEREVHRDSGTGTSASKKSSASLGAVVSASAPGVKVDRKIIGIHSTSTQVRSQSQPQSADRPVAVPAREVKSADSRARKVGDSALGGSSAKIISYDDSLFTLLDEMGV